MVEEELRMSPDLFDSHTSPTPRIRSRLAQWLPITAAAGLALVLLAGGCSKQGGDYVAKVGKERITVADFKDEMIKRYRREDIASQRTMEERREIVTSMAETKMKLQDAYRMGLDRDSAAVAMAEETRKQAAIQELYKVEILDKVVPASEIRDTYDKMGEEIKAGHILIKSPMGADSTAPDLAKIRIDSMKAALNEGANFDTLAKLLSEDVTTAQNSGDLGYFTWGRMVDEFQAAAFSLKPGQISDPVKTSFGWHLIKVYDRRPVADRKSFEEEENNILMMLRRKYQGELTKAAEDYLAKLKEDNGLKYDYTIIQKILDKVSDPSVPRNNDYFSNFSAEEKEWTVATMNGRTIRVSDLAPEVVKMGGNPHWTDQKSITQMVERMVVPEMLAQRAKDKGLYKAKSVDQAYRTTLESQLMPLVEKQHVEDEIDLSPEALQAYYQSHMNDFMTDSTVTVQEIYVTIDEAKGKNLAFANKIALRARKGEDFTKLVHQYTDRKSSIPQDGRLGPLTSRQYGEMGKAAFAMQIGQISDPIAMGARAYSIIKLVDKTEPSVKSFEEAQDQVKRQIRMSAGDSLRAAWMEELKERYPITINEEALKSALPLAAADSTAPGVKGSEMGMRGTQIELEPGKKK
jgi:peptidyl-prolyl cis-trans isomerase C